MEITLAKALKVKNLVVAEMRRLENDIRAQNSLLVDAEPEVDVRAFVERVAHLQRSLITLKLEIEKSSQPIRQNILLISELKHHITWLRGIPTTHGVTLIGGSYGVVAVEKEYNAQLRKADVDRLVNKAERQIETLQDQIDAFNHATMFEYDVASLGFD